MASVPAAPVPPRMTWPPLVTVALIVPVPVRAPPLMLRSPPLTVPPLTIVEPAVWV